MRAFLFPGQGSQSVGMGAALAEASRAAKDVFGDVDEALGQGLFRLMREVPDEEFETHGCNVLALAPMRVLVCDGSPVTRARLEAAGCNVAVYTGDELSHNRAGGPTCLTRPILRG